MREPQAIDDRRRVFVVALRVADAAVGSGGRTIDSCAAFSVWPTGLGEDVRAVRGKHSVKPEAAKSTEVRQYRNRRDRFRPDAGNEVSLGNLPRGEGRQTPWG